MSVHRAQAHEFSPLSVHRFKARYHFAVAVLSTTSIERPSWRRQPNIVSHRIPTSQAAQGTDADMAITQSPHYLVVQVTALVNEELTRPMIQTLGPDLNAWHSYVPARTAIQV